MVTDSIEHLAKKPLIKGILEVFELGCRIMLLCQLENIACRKGRPLVTSPETDFTMSKHRGPGSKCSISLITVINETNLERDN